MTEQTDARMIIGKLLNEQPNRELDRVALAELCAEVDALRKELEQVKMHKVMLLDAAINADVTLSDYEYSDHFSRKGISNAITATSEQIEAYKQEIIAQAKEEQLEADARFVSLTSRYYSESTKDGVTKQITHIVSVDTINAIATAILARNIEA